MSDSYNLQVIKESTWSRMAKLMSTSKDVGLKNAQKDNS